jgi:hypothetical protein
MRRTAFAALIGAAVVLTACGSSTADRVIPGRPLPPTSTWAYPPTPTSTVPASEPELKAASEKALEASSPEAYDAAEGHTQSLALSLEQMPSNWYVNNAPNQHSASCYSDPMLEVPPLTYAGVVFDGDGGEYFPESGGHAPELVEVIGDYDYPALTFATFKGNLDDCPSFTQYTQAATETGVPVDGTMGQISAPKYGAESVAYTASIAEDGTPAVQGIIMARKGNYIVKLALSGIHSFDRGLLEHLMTQAMADVP